MFARSPMWLVLALAVAAFWNDITMGSAWASCIDIGQRYSGIVSGCMNTIGNLGGFLAGWATGWILDHYTAPARPGVVTTAAAYVGSIGSASLGSFGNASLVGGIGQALGDMVPLQHATWQLKQATEAGWQINFLSYTAAYVFAVLCWLFFDASRPVTQDAKTLAAADHSTGIRENGRYHEGS
jgi:hypothetical protein